MTKALVLSGGGAKGQYHVGAVRALHLDVRRQYEILCGVSVGALVAAHLAQYAIGEEHHAQTALESLFTPIRTADIYRKWRPFGILHAPWKSSLYNADPLRRLIERNLDPARVRASGRKLRIGAVSLSTGDYRVFGETDVPLREIVDASSAFPVAFQPGRFGNQWWSDGGIKSVTPIQAAIDAGADEIDVVMTSPPGSEPVFERDPEVPDVALRAVELMSDRIIEVDVKVAQLYSRLALAQATTTKRYIEIRVIRPKSVLLKDPLHFDREDATRLQIQGYRDALLAFP